MQLEDIVLACGYRISGGSEYQWKCYGKNAHFIDFEADVRGGVDAISAVFDTKTQRVFEVTISPVGEGREMVWIDPDYRTAQEGEAKSRGVAADMEDEVSRVTLEMEEDVIEKASSVIITGTCEENVKIPLNIDDESLLVIMKLAHAKDVTLNQFVEGILREELDKFESGSGCQGGAAWGGERKEPHKKNKKNKKNKKMRRQ